MRITAKGQVTIPQDIRERTGLLPNTEVEFVVDGDVVTLIKAVVSRKPTRGQLLVESSRATSRPCRHVDRPDHGPDAGRGLMSTLVDSDVLIDVLGPPGPWTTWSASALRDAQDEDVLILNPIVYGELSVGFDAIEALDDALPRDLIRREDIPYAAAFLAGRCFLDYRRRGGSRTGILPDFYIGAHAAVSGYRLLTRDAARYRTYFPRLEIIAPD